MDYTLQLPTHPFFSRNNVISLGELKVIASVNVLDSTLKVKLVNILNLVTMIGDFPGESPRREHYH